MIRATTRHPERFAMLRRLTSMFLVLCLAAGAHARDGVQARDATAVQLPAGAQFRECSDCPAMLVVPPGSVQMGFDGGEPDRYEGPVHSVRIRRAFAVGLYEITNAQYAAFVQATGHTHGVGCNVWVPDEHTIRKDDSLTWRDPGYGRPPRDDEPVACVNWNDAQAYVAWLRQITGQKYRLLSEAEWEYVARAGSAAAYPWGDDPEGACRYANVYDATAVDPRTPWPATKCADGHVGVAPVGSLAPNALGLYDVIGNVWEWVEDCYAMPYPARPIDGSAQTRAGCDRHGVRGGSWRTDVRRQRPAFRGRDEPTLNSNIFGLRVARDLP
jgi:formylglycine-generating enzyme required for sulfatase activity